MKRLYGSSDRQHATPASRDKSWLCDGLTGEQLVTGRILRTGHSTSPAQGEEKEKIQRINEKGKTEQII
jgi:hypothetical protein